MGREQKIWAVKRRLKLIQELGGECVQCGSISNLELDHIHGKDWVARELGSDQRVCLYIKEAAQGLIQVLCKSCNVKKGDHNFPARTMAVCPKTPFNTVPAPAASRVARSKAGPKPP